MMESINNYTSIAALAKPSLDIYRDYKEMHGFSLYAAPLLTALCVFGVISNAINVAVFSQLLSQQDTTNISLLGLSVSDLLVCLTGFMSAFCEWPFVQELIVQHLNWHPTHMNWVFLVQVHILVSRTNLSITAFITLERCLCVAMPLKVKRIITPKVVKIIVIFSYILPLVLYSPILAYTYIEKCFSPDLNRYIYCYYLYMSTYGVMKRIYVPFTVWLSYGVQFSLIIICTIILIVTLIKKRGWRTNATSSKSTSMSNSEENRVVKMMAMVSSMFIVCNLPVVAGWMGHSAVEEFNTHGSLRYSLVILSYVAHTMEALGASLNLFIYLTHSTKYKEMFDKMFAKCRKPVEMS